MSLEFKFINNEHSHYTIAVELRKELFFNNSNEPQFINDELEENSYHLIALNQNDLVGYARLTHKENKAIISQMAICKNHQKKGIGSKILKILINESEREDKITKIELEARITAKDFYQKKGFKSIGEQFSSLKTGITHQRMIKFC